MFLGGRVRPRLLALAAAVVLAVSTFGGAHAQSTALNGYLFDAELWSPILGQEMTFRVYLPPDYYSNTERRYPALYMLHGAGGNYTEWSDSFLPEQLDDMIGLQ